MIVMDIMYSRLMGLIGSKRGAAQELVQALGLSKNTVTEWRAGRSKSYTKYAPQIAAYYGVSLDWLSGATDEKEKSSPTPESEEAKLRREIYAQLDTLSIEQLEKLNGILDLLR